MNATDPAPRDAVPSPSTTGIDDVSDALDVLPSQASFVVEQFPGNRPALTILVDTLEEMVSRVEYRHGPLPDGR